MTPAFLMLFVFCLAALPMWSALSSGPRAVTGSIRSVQRLLLIRPTLPGSGSTGQESGVGGEFPGPDT